MLLDNGKPAIDCVEPRALVGLNFREPAEDFRVSLLRRRDRRHRIGDFAKQRSEGVMFGSIIGAFGARFGKLSKDFLALLRQKPEIDAFIGHGVIMLPYPVARKFEA